MAVGKRRKQAVVEYRNGRVQRETRGYAAKAACCRSGHRYSEAGQEGEKEGCCAVGRAATVVYGP